MADQVRIVITATDKTQAGIQSVEGRIEGLAAKAQDSLQQVAIGAGVAAAAIGAVANSSIQAYADMERNLKSLDAVERGFLGTTGTLAQKAKELQDEFFGLSATSGSLRNLISSGLGADKAAALIEVFKERAILLGNATIPLEQRLLNLTQAFKTEQSELGDASGMTENFSQIVARGSEIVGKNADEMSKAERANAKYAAIVEMSAPFIGQAADLTESLTGKQASLTQETTRSQQAIGSALAPAYKVLLDTLTPLVQASRQYAEENPNIIMALTAVAGGAVATTAAVAGLSAAFLALTTAMGPIGLLVTGISAAVGAIGGLVLATAGIKRQQDETRDSTLQLMREYEGLRGVLDDNTTSTDQKKLASERLKGVLDQLFGLQPQMRNWFDEEGRLLDGATEKWDKYRDAVARAKSVELRQSISKAQEELNGLRDELSNTEASIRKDYDPFVKARAQQARIRFGEAAAQEVLREAEGEIQDVIALETADLEAKVALLEAQLTKDQALLDAINEPADVSNLLKPPPKTDPGPPPPGGSQMSAPLKADMEDLDDLKAYEQTPDRLKAVLEKTREILRVHGAELAKLGKDRDLIRQRDIQLPDQIAQAEYQAALTQLDADKTIQNLSPEKFAEGLRGIKDKFSAYLEAHPDLALQMDLRLKGATDEELRAPLERWRKEMQQSEQLGIFDGLEYLKVGKLREGLSLAQTAGDADAVIELTAQIRELEAAMQEAAFDAKFKAIRDAREQAFAGAAKELSDLQKQLITEESKGDKTDPDEVARIKQRMLDAVRPAIEAERDALQNLLDSTTGNDEASVKRREEINRALTSVMSELYSQDVDAHRIATEAKTAQERTAAERRKDIQNDAMDAFSKAEKRALEDFKAGAKAQEDYLQGQIDLRERLLKQYDRQIAVEERLKKIRDAQADVDLLQQTGQREMVFNADGSRGYRIVGMDEAQKALDEAKLEHQRQTNREALQDEITNLRERLDSLKESNRTREEELRTHFANAREVLETGFNEMNGVQGAKLDTMATELQTKLTNALGIYQTYVRDVNAELDKIKTASTPATTATSTTTTPTVTPASTAAAGAVAGLSGKAGGLAGAAVGILQGLFGAVPRYGVGTYADTPHLAVVGDQPEFITPEAHIPRLAGLISDQLARIQMPSMPSLAFGGGAAVTIGSLQLNMPNVTDAAGFARELPGALEAAGIEGGLRSGISLGRMRGVRRT